MEKISPEYMQKIRLDSVRKSINEHSGILSALKSLESKLTSPVASDVDICECLEYKTRRDFQFLHQTLMDKIPFFQDAYLVVVGISVDDAKVPSLDFFRVDNEPVPVNIKLLSQAIAEAQNIFAEVPAKIHIGACANWCWLTKQSTYMYIPDEMCKFL